MAGGRRAGLKGERLKLLAADKIPSTTSHRKPLGDVAGLCLTIGGFGQNSERSFTGVPVVGVRTHALNHLYIFLGEMLHSMVSIVNKTTNF